MSSAKIKRLQATGWTIGNAGDFLRLGEKETTPVKRRSNRTEATTQAIESGNAMKLVPRLKR